MLVQKILWPTDFSTSAEKALPYVRSLSEQYGAEIHVMYVIEDIACQQGWYGEFNLEHIQRLMVWEEDKAQERLQQVCSSHLRGCPRFVRHVAVGDPAREILDLIDAEQFDMVVMSTRGAKSHFPFGGVIEKVVRNASVPVVSVPVKEV